jgi:hypothetical protein
MAGIVFGLRIPAVVGANERFCLPCLPRPAVRMPSAISADRQGALQRSHNNSSSSNDPYLWMDIRNVCKNKLQQPYTADVFFRSQSRKANQIG